VKVLSNAAAIGVPAASRRPSTLTVYAVSPRRSAAGSNVIDSRIFREPNPFNPSGNRRPDDGPIYEVNLNSRFLPLPRLHAERGVVHVPSFTDLRLHDISDGADDPNIEAIDMHAPAGSPGFFAGNRRFITRKLWGAANEPPYFHHGQYTTLREAVLAHGGDAAWTRTRFNALSAGERDAVIEFLKSLQVLPPGTPTLVVDERGRPRM
jgi:hypothetical protein